MGQPVSPSSEYLNNSIISLSIIAVLESEVPLDDIQHHYLLQDLLLPINPRFSSIMARDDAKGVMVWKKVHVNLDDHVYVPEFEPNMSIEFYDNCLEDYLANLGLSRFPEGRPLWDVHVIKYPTSGAAGSIIFRLHHSLGDGFTLMGILLSCLQRADDPSLPLTFPSNKHRGSNLKNSIVGGVLSSVANTFSDVCSILKNSLVADSKSAVRSGHNGIEFFETSIVNMTFSMNDVKQIKTNLGVTINDVICGTIFMGVRNYMETVEPGSGRSTNTTSLVLLNTRMIQGYNSIKEMVEPSVAATKLPWGNHFTFLNVSVPKLHYDGTNKEVNPLEFVLKTHEMVKRKRNSMGVYLTAMYLQLVRKFRGPEAVSKYLYDTLKNSSFTITNIKGPIEKMALANYPIKGLYFVVHGDPEVSYIQSYSSIFIKKQFNAILFRFQN
ncbi:Wax ester synthase/diacylglycerol acyltransferase 11 [Linum perenne]